MPASPSPRRRRAAAAATSDELVAAAIRVIGHHGVAAATTRRIADEAGVPLGTVHYWFSDKEQLLAEVVRVVVDQIERASAVANPSDTPPSPAELRETLGAAFTSIADDDAGVQLGYYELTALALRTPRLRELARHQYRSYRALAARALTPALDGVDPDRAAAIAELVMVTFDGLTLSHLADPEGTHPEAVLDLLAELVSRQAVS
ncbi:MAG: TetR family transcriptional regulator [Nocardioidaceae bacterium]|nr:TetR family transcriptional regulator [Nocardioidaceae bacterium]